MLITAALVSLFLDLEVLVAGAKLRPFDGIVLLMLVHLLVTRGPNLRIPLGLVLCGLFFLVHASSALALGPANFLRESIQVCVIFVFSLYLYNAFDPDRLPAWLATLTFCVITILLFNVLWHVSQGYYTGWKRLDAAKMTFLFSAPLLTYYALKHRLAPTTGTLWATFALPMMVPILLLSGERKALLFFLACTLVYLLRAKPFFRPAGWLATILALVVALPLIPGLFEIPYVAKQLDSLLSPFASAELRLYSASDYQADSLSNAQRLFAVQTGLSLFAERPVLGVGTNTYQQIVTARFAYLPKVMLLSIHSEFLRVLVENGLIGLLVFLLPLLRTLLFVAQWRDRRQESTAWYGCILFVLAALLFLATEASGTKLFAPYVMVAMLPELVRRATMATSSAVPSAFAPRRYPASSWSHR